MLWHIFGDASQVVPYSEQQADQTGMPVNSAFRNNIMLTTSVNGSTSRENLIGLLVSVSRFCQCSVLPQTRFLSPAFQGTSGVVTGSRTQGTLTLAWFEHVAAVQVISVARSLPMLSRVMVKLINISCVPVFILGSSQG